MFSDGKLQDQRNGHSRQDSASSSRSTSRPSSSNNKDKARERFNSAERRSKKRNRSREGRNSVERPLAGTLGDLVFRAKAEKRRKEEKLEQEEPKKQAKEYEEDSPLDIKQKLEQRKEDLPHIELFMDEPVIMNPDPPFDPTTMRIRSQIPSVQVFKNGYLKSGNCVYSSHTERKILATFNEKVLSFLKKKRNAQPKCPLLQAPLAHSTCRCGRDNDASDSSSSSSSSSEDEEPTTDKMSTRRRNKELLRKEIERKQNHPAALHRALIFNESEMTNDGAICRCPPRYRREGIRHQVFMGEERIPPCNPNSNNADLLYHYVLTVNSAVNLPGTNYSTIRHENINYTFKGFSVFFHRPLPTMFPKNPICRWNTEIEFEFVQEPVPEGFTVAELEAFSSYILDYTLELYDFPRFPKSDGEDTCPVYHFMPRYTSYAEGVNVMLPMSVVLDFFNKTFRPFLSSIETNEMKRLDEEQLKRFGRDQKHFLVINPSKRPATIRLDGLLWNPGDRYPQLVHSTNRCPAYLSISLAEQQALQKRVNKLKKVMRMKKVPLDAELDQIRHLNNKIEDMKAVNSTLRSLQVIVSSENFYRTGFAADIVTHVLTLSLACFHARLHLSFDKFEEKIKYRFINRTILELALIHPSFKQNFGMTSDHARNALLNCGYKRIFKQERQEDIKRLGGGPRMAEQIVSGGLKVKTNQIVHNERLEYLGDAVVEMIVTNRLFFMFPHHQEGGLASYRSAIVQNRNLAELARKINLQHYLLFAHGPDLCHEDDFRHALANAFEAIMGALYLDSAGEEADRIFSDAMWGDDQEAKSRWDALNQHDLVAEHPDGDRHLIEQIPILKNLVQLEETIGYTFKHIRVLAKAFTRRCIPYNDLTRGHNQRLEWLGDTVLQLIVSEYLYRHFPYHNEGHLSLLRTCIVSNRTQALISDELGFHQHTIKPSRKNDNGMEMKMKDKADLVESLLGAIFVDGGIQYCENFIRIMFLPRLRFYLVQKRWSDEKSQLQHACLALRNVKSKKPECPQYRMLSKTGPTNSRVYTVGVFFRNKKLAEGVGSTLHMAEMEAAKLGLEAIRHLLGDSDPDYVRPGSSQRKRVTPPAVPGNIPSLMSFPLPQSTALLPPPPPSFPYPIPYPGYIYPMIPTPSLLPPHPGLIPAPVMPVYHYPAQYYQRQ